MSAEPVHDRDGVDEDVECTGARPQGKDEAERHDVDASALEHLVQGRRDHLIDRRGRQGLRRQVNHPILEDLDLGDVVALREIADGAGQPEHQRRQRQDGEERRLSGQARHPVREAGRGGSRRQPAKQTPPVVETSPQGVNRTGATRSVTQPVSQHGDYRSHMRTLSAAAIFGAVITFSSALALRAPDATIAVAAVAAVTAFVTWLSALHSDDQASGLALSSPAVALTLVAVRRYPGSSVLPLIAAQVVGSVAGGFAALGVGRSLGGALTWSDPSPVAVAVVVAFLGLLASWVTLAVDGGENVAWTTVPPLVSAAALGVGLTAALNPAVVVGLATAGIVSWITAGTAASVGLIAAFLGAYLVSAVSPKDTTTE